MTQPSGDLDMKGLNFPLRMQPAARHMMNSAIGVTARRVVRVVMDARNDGLPVALLEVAAGPEPMLPDWQEVVIRVSVLLSPEEAVAAWERLARRLETLRESLDFVEREILEEAVALELIWKQNGNGNGNGAAGHGEQADGPA